MNAINAAKRLRIAASDEAEADKIKVVKAAEAEAEKNFLHGKGIAKSRKEVMRGMKEAVADFQAEVVLAAPQGGRGHGTIDPGVCDGRWGASRRAK